MKKGGDEYPATPPAQDNSQESQAFSGEAAYPATRKREAHSPPAGDCATQAPAQVPPPAPPGPPPAAPPQACRAPSPKGKTLWCSGRLYQIRVF